MQIPTTPIVVVGSYVQDQIFTVPEFPTTGQTRIGNYQTGPGGKGSNQAVAAARTGVSTAFIGAVGADAFAQIARDFHASEGIASHLIQDNLRPSGTAGILVNEQGENQIVVALGANEFLKPAAIPEVFIRDSKVLVTQLECNLKATEHALKVAKSNDVTTVLNPAPMRDDFPMRILATVDILIPNETEFAHLVRKKFPHKYPDFSDESLLSETPEELHQLCRSFNVPTVIITLGSRGCLVSTCDSYFMLPSLSDVDVVDTTGAGDAFVGGFASGMVQLDGDLIEAARYATLVAGLSVGKLGTAPAMPYTREIMAVLDTNPFS